ncbi:hypothetical protein B0I18_102102 [Taibaiella chishuiensis]|uniref:Uncharacterized protein n=1 Tax=Taibaiella chishuiensis TaxID=1434707 RepID=A0A2P8D7E6_9BACT|nr:hypothetical protein B0I18_102102 [Taibaiella chishuiensis]
MGCENCKVAAIKLRINKETEMFFIYSQFDTLFTY